ncbi:uncharacterized protein Z520_08770 [Fonsecaea multimorphosa CBS 102226]|uniref:Uncharacterized protein n=1 Tax=Fonsecaea multimorphosa CBS 102226 TaxID=1442371 RepID=A0A0D2H1D0_9EURO|nr:uncharacterized protein Z520_08770 [Fonsecaea multimorphosa CBS 102226]KIX95650.1 hypothetical protein Z520_08770 [Fonsecaea multimorphosa CBS 102226]OAL21251.1 hypothetical protein AYO22_08214 [Fonsecaea multimorphosa]
MLAPVPEGAVFFLEWPMWARLALILGGLLTLILTTAFVVKLRNWARDRRLERRAAEEQAERGEMTLVNCLDEDIPFGIRALIEDPEVEGVWNARTATALHLDGARSPPPSHLTFKPVKYSSITSSSTCDPTDIGLVSPDAPTPFTDSTTVVDPPAESSSSKKGKSIVISYNDPYICAEGTEISPGLAISRVLLVADLTTDNGYTGVIPAMTKDSLIPSPSKLQLRPITNLRSSGARKFVIGNRERKSQGLQRPESRSEPNPLEGMEAHRRFHAAESGQLLPRNRRHTEMVLTPPFAPSLSDSEDSDDSASRALSWPARNGSINLGKQFSRSVKRMEGPRPVPFRAFIESLPTTKAPPSAWTEKTQARVDAKILPSPRTSDTGSNTSRHTPSSSTSSMSVTTTTSPSDSISIVNTRSRKVNDGFEVLPAGTLEKGPKVKDFGARHEDVDMRKKPNKLKKRSRSSSGSRRSSTESRRLSTDSFRLPVF